MSRATSAWSGQVMTVDGPVPGDQLGFTLPHEHLLVDGWGHREVNYANSAYMELAKVVAAGGRTIVDLAALGFPRDPAFVRDLARRAGLQVVLGTGFRRGGWLPETLDALSVEELAALLERELVGGDADGIRSGVIGVVGVSRRPMKIEDRAVVAAAMAQARTGAGIVIALEVGARPEEFDRALDLLVAGGADLHRVAVGGLVARPDNLPTCRRIAERGSFILFDLFGQEHRRVMDDLMDTPADVQAASLKGFVDQGLADHLLISQGVDHVELFTVNGAEGYVHILRNVLRRAAAYRVRPEEIDTITIANPRRLLEYP